MTDNVHSTLYNLNVERAVLSAIIFEPQIFEEIAVKLDSNDFYLPFHQHVYKAITELNSEDKPVDEEFLKSKLLKDRNFDEIALLDILAVNSISNVDAYLDDMKEKSRCRRLSYLGTSIRKQIDEDGANSEDVIGFVGKSIDSIDEESLDREKGTNSIIDGMLKMMESAREAGHIIGLRTGLLELDKLEVITKAGDLVIIGARPSVGKTALMQSLIANMIRSGKKVLVSSLDMDAEMLILRLVSTMNGEPLADLKRGLIRNPHDFHSTLSLIRERVIIHDEKGVSWQKIKLKSKRVFRKHPDIEGWFLDHIGKIKYRDTNQIRFEIGEVTSDAKAMGQEFNLVPHFLTQLNRNITNRANPKPNLGDLKESSAMEEDATHVLMPHRDSYFEKGKHQREPDETEAEIIVAKNQSGPTGVAKMKFEAKFTRFVDDVGFEVVYTEQPSPVDMPHRFLG